MTSMAEGLPLRASHRSIALKLPDLPRWVEARSLLLEEFGEILGFEEKSDPSSEHERGSPQSVKTLRSPAPGNALGDEGYEHFQVKPRNQAEAAPSEASPEDTPPEARAWEPAPLDLPNLSLVLRDPEARSIFVIGRPIEDAIEAAIEKNGHGGEVIAPHEQAAWIAEILPGWKRAAIIVHHLPDMHRLPATPDGAPPGAPSGAVNFLDPAAIPQLAIEDELKQELISGAEQSLIAATFVGQQPVSFCYAGAITESLWDISIDTVPEQQRKGYATLCVVYMIRYLHAQGKRPVWQALEDNPASWQLAQKLGFVPVDELALFTP